MKLNLLEYLKLSKPRITLAVLLTGAAGLSIEGSYLADPLRFFLVILGLFMISSSSNGLNQYFERDIDASMSRTSAKRPLPMGSLQPYQALVFSIGIGFAGVAFFAYLFNLLSAGITLFFILFYGIFYTIYLKPRTHFNTVIGGVAGALGPIIAWAAAAGSLNAAAPWLMFLIIFLWSPPHFWALAIYLKDDYIKSGLPMLPLVKGEKVARQQIYYYTLTVFASSLALILVLPDSFIYPVAAIVLGGVFVQKAFLVRAIGRTEMGLERGFFGYSIIYLLALCLSLLVDGMI